MFLFDFLLRLLKQGNKPKGFSEELISDSNLEEAKDEVGKSSVSENDVKVISNHIYQYLNHKYIIKGDFKFLDALPILQRVIEI
jgi:hypothetical protein